MLLTAILVRALRAVLRSRSDLVVENLALRQQVEALKRRRPRPQLDDVDCAFWVAMRSAWRGWAERLILVEPETAVKWHRERFRRYWTVLSRHERGVRSQNRNPGVRPLHVITDRVEEIGSRLLGKRRFGLRLDL